MKIVEMLKKGEGLEKIAHILNDLDHGGRLDEIYRIKGKDQAALYELAEDSECSLEKSFVPPNFNILQPVVHWGVNSLPMFTRFQKVMCRPASAKNGIIAVGYNEQPLKPITGPGYFVVRRGQNPDGKHQAVIDYTQLPTEKAENWPEIIPNSARLSRFIYNNTQDWMWKVSHHISIGRASRDGQWLDNWFILVRED